MGLFIRLIVTFVWIAAAAAHAQEPDHFAQRFDNPEELAKRVDDPAPDQRADAGDAGVQAVALSRELMSPFCPGLLLADCQSSAAHELRGEIRGRFARGETADGIVADLVARFGPRVRGMPAAEGAGLLAWVVPGLLGAAMLVVLAWRIRRATSAAATPDAGLPPEDPGVTARLDRELWALD